MSPVRNVSSKDSIRVALDALRKDENGSTALEVLCILSYFSPEDIDVKIFSSLVDDAGKLTAVIELLDWHAMVSTKADCRGVITVDEDVKAFVRASKKTHVKEAVLGKALELLYLNKIFNVNHAISVWNYAIEFPELISKFALLPSLVLSELCDLLNFEEAYSFWPNALNALIKVVGKTHYAVSRLKCEASLLSCLMGTHEGDLVILLMAVENGIKLCGIKDIQWRIIRVAEQLTEMSRLHEATVLHHTLLGDEKKISEICDHRVLRAWGNFACLLGAKGDFVKSLVLLGDVHDKRHNLMKSLNDDSLIKMYGSEILFQMSDMGYLLILESKYEGALDIYRIVFREFKKLFGMNNLYTLRAKSNFGLALMHAKRFTEASMIFNEVAENNEEWFGSEHSDFLTAKSNTAALLNIQGNFQAALEIWTDVYRAQLKTLGKNHEDTLNSKREIANLLATLEMYDEAFTEYHKEILPGYLKIYGLNHPETLQVKSEFALLQTVSKNYAVETSLHLAAKEGDYEQVYFLIETGSIVNAKDNLENTSLHYAAACGHVKVVKLLLRKGACYNSKNKDRKTPLQVTKNKAARVLLTSVSEMFEHVKAGNNQEFSKYIKETSIINAKGSDGSCLIHWAAYCGHTEILKLLLVNGADVTLVTKKGNTALHLAVSRSNFEAVEVMLKHSKENKLDRLIDVQTTLEQSTCLHIAVKNGSLPLVKTLLTHGAIYNLSNRDSKVPLDLSDNRMISFFLKFIEKLFEYAVKGSSELIDVLQHNEYDEFKAVTNARNVSRKTLVDILERFKHKNIANGVTELIKNRNENHTQVRKTLELEELLKLRESIEVHAQFSEMYRLILKCIIKSDHSYEYINFNILEKTAHYLKNVRRIIADYKNCFPGLVRDENIQVLVETLDELHISESESTSLYDRLGNGKIRSNESFLETVEFSIEARVNKYLQWVEEQLQIHGLGRLLKAIESNSNVEVETCLNMDTAVINGIKSVESADGQKMPLHYAVEMGNSEIVKALLEKGAVVTQTSKQGLTPLHITCQNDDETIFEMLMQNVSKEELGSFVNAQIKDCGSSSLHLAAQKGNLKIIKSLLNNGAKYNISNNMGNTPLQCSTTKDVSDLLKLVEEHFNAAASGRYEMFYDTASKMDVFPAIMNARNKDDRLIPQEAVFHKKVETAGHLLMLMKGTEQELSRMKSIPEHFKRRDTFLKYVS